MSDDKRASGMNRRAMLQKTVAAGALAWAAPAIISAPAHASGSCGCTCSGTVYGVKWDNGKVDTLKDNPGNCLACSTALPPSSILATGPLTGSSVSFQLAPGVTICSWVFKVGNCSPSSCLNLGNWQNFDVSSSTISAGPKAGWTQYTITNTDVRTGCGLSHFEIILCAGGS